MSGLTAFFITYFSEQHNFRNIYKSLRAMKKKQEENTEDIKKG